jgi:hypothetical protein
MTIPTRHDTSPDGTDERARRHKPADADHTAQPVDTSEESAAGEEDPGSGVDAPLDPATPKKHSP